MLAALVVLVRSLALICCGHRAVALENLALRSSWRCSDAPPSVPHSGPEIDCFGSCSPTRGGIGTLAERQWMVRQQLRFDRPSVFSRSTG